ncbi:27551_t:CDS:2 [Gigaspora margarita]|uniref:27551_t:CDS:1 n=1 Tax=Gigaspora margarita TaxID=4874 RepID=A0ABN7VBN6_GIGMA|nr:27551_t:CDS:2 [Gigaspora margarita]
MFKNDKNKSNAKAVCICCIQKVEGLAIAQVTPECFTSNKAKLCHNHLANCKNFKNSYSNEEAIEILSCPVSKNLKKNKNYYDDISKVENNSEEHLELQNLSKCRKSTASTALVSSIASFTSSLFKQNSITTYSTPIIPEESDNSDNNNQEANKEKLNGQTIHPADDELAKWPLESLFTINLEPPTFLDTTITVTDV